eukprot:366289-Chlamydomonas_euryale.AAC.9
MQQADADARESGRRGEGRAGIPREGGLVSGRDSAVDSKTQQWTWTVRLSSGQWDSAVDSETHSADRLRPCGAPNWQRAPHWQRPKLAAPPIGAPNRQRPQLAAPQLAACVGHCALYWPPACRVAPHAPPTACAAPPTGHPTGHCTLD